MNIMKKYFYQQPMILGEADSDLEMNYEGLFHLSPSKNIDSILQNGLKANKEGHIFVFTNRLLENSIARDQVFTDRYGVFEINNTIYGDMLKNDDVAEISAIFHRVINQDIIGPEHLKLIEEKETIFDRPLEWDYLKYRKMFNLSRVVVDKMFNDFMWYNEEMNSYKPPYRDLFIKMKNRLKRHGLKVSVNEYGLIVLVAP